MCNYWNRSCSWQTTKRRSDYSTHPTRLSRQGKTGVIDKEAAKQLKNRRDVDPSQFQDRLKKGLCGYCAQKWTRGHRCLSSPQPKETLTTLTNLVADDSQDMYVYATTFGQPLKVIVDTGAQTTTFNNSLTAQS